MCAVLTLLDAFQQNVVEQEYRIGEAAKVT